MAYIVVDVESDGPCPSLYSMISFGAVLVRDPSKTFYRQLMPVSEKWIPEALAVSGFTREETMKFGCPKEAMKDFDKWIKEVCGDEHPIFISDNNGFDWQFINWYFWNYLNKNPFGFSSRRIGDLYCGIVKDTFARWKHLRDTKHTHNPVDDAKGNAEVIVKLKRNYGLNIKL